MTAAMAWRAGLAYSRTGVRRCQMRRQLFGFLTVLFCLPVGLALALSVGFPQAPWLGPTTFVLSSITVIGGGLSLMVAVEASVRGESIGPATVIRRAIGYLPRYVLTNAHTTVFYWSIMGPAIYLAGTLTAGRPVGLVVAAWALVVVVGVVVHLHTLFAPYMAVHSDLHPTRAAIEGFRLARSQFALSAATFVSATAGIGVPLLLAIGALWIYATREGPATAQLFDVALPYLMAALVQLVRPVMVASLHAMYEDFRPLPS
jgi:hypothetical protein